MSDEQTRAWREAFCYWVGDTFLAALCSAAGGPLGLLVWMPQCFDLWIVTACLAFVAALAAAAVVRALFVNKVHYYTMWMVLWVIFGAVAGTVWTGELYGF
jgi:hypothetical protein